MDLAALRKSLTRHQAALKKAEGALRDVEALPAPLAAASAYAGDDALRALDGALRDLDDVAASVGALREQRAALEHSVRAALGDASAKLAAHVAGALSPEAPVGGQLPELRWGLFRLEFKLAGPKREVIVWYGPKVAKLATSAAEGEAVIAAARDARAALDREPLDAARFGDDVRGAYEATRRRLGVEPQGAVPLLQVLQSLVLLRQPAAFVADPVREHFVPYSRVQLSYDLYRAGRIPGVALAVAAHAQTKRAEDHLWVPTAPNGEGTHFASLAVRERRDG